MKLPQQFEDKMKILLGDEFDDYIKSYDNPKYQGIRINTSKISMDEWEKINPFSNLQPVPWCKEGFYYFDERPAKHPFYYAGLYYIQEPSAMSTAEFLPVDSGDIVLDLCAAPGGKSTQVGAKLAGTGVLVSNDISASRAKTLAKNIDAFGLKYAMVVSEDPSKLAGAWQNTFDKIIIDAPCSGEGMFRKDPEAIKSWEKYGVKYFCDIQKTILDDASVMLKEGGNIVYSTCTFSPEENEQMICDFLDRHPEFEVEPLVAIGGISPARKDWCSKKELEGAVRLWPHKIDGEGHFICLLRKKFGNNIKNSMLKPTQQIKHYKEIADFITKHTYINISEFVLEKDGRVYIVSEEMPEQNKIRMHRSGLLLGEMKKNRFEVSHTVAVAYKKEMYKNTIELDYDSAVKYLKGETLVLDAPQGYHVVCIQGYPLGWVVSQNGRLKNKYPANLRMMG
ncbi:MAG: RNA methyltransferase [Epulopiscium sp. Nele67-Bin004]|nr:MAG: RNA methyltransferase [Epulopiscium sp. Nele67-Bin004]